MHLKANAFKILDEDREYCIVFWKTCPSSLIHIYFTFIFDVKFSSEKTSIFCWWWKLGLWWSSGVFTAFLDLQIHSLVLSVTKGLIELLTRLDNLCLIFSSTKDRRVSDFPLDLLIVNWSNWACAQTDVLKAKERYCYISHERLSAHCI